MLHFKGNIFSPDGKKKVEIERARHVTETDVLGTECAEEVLRNGGKEINELIRQQLRKSSPA
jgi:hydroxymethylbilane synthase